MSFTAPVVFVAPISHPREVSSSPDLIADDTLIQCPSRIRPPRPSLVPNLFSAYSYTAPGAGSGVGHRRARSEPWLIWN